MRSSSPHPQLRQERGCVVSYCSVASSIGSRVLRQGGNAVDAAVATALALAVTYPQAGNLGGGGFMLIHDQRSGVHFLDYRERAPRRIRSDHFVAQGRRLGEQSVLGALAVAVPGTVAGLHEAVVRHGSWPWERVVGPAIELAEQGTWITSRQAGYFEVHHENLDRFPATRRCFTDQGGPLLPGTLFRQPDLAWTLRQLSEHGPDVFYRGEVGRRIVAEIERGGGVLDAEDLDAYRPVWRAPLHRRFYGRDVYSSSLPSGGGLVIQTSLGLIEAEGLTRWPRASVERADLFGRIFRVAFTERNRAGDPDRLAPEVEQALRRSATAQVAPGDLARREAALSGGRRVVEGNNTTHFCVIDGEGNAVANTVSLNTMFGSKLVADGTGVLLNNSLDDFCIASDVPNWYDLVQSDENGLRGGARALSSMAPTLVLGEDRRIELIAGGSGGPRIPTMVVQVLIGVLLDRLPLVDAMRAPRVHHQGAPGGMVLEQEISNEIERGLVARGHSVARVPLLGIGTAIHRDREGELLHATLDPRFSFE